MSFQTDLYDGLVQDTITLTNRPDLEAETEIAVRTATSSAHHSDMYPRDQVTQLVQLPNQVYAVSLDITNLFPRFRALSTIRPVDVNFAALLGEESDIEVVELGDIRNPDGSLKNAVAYVAGSSINVRYQNGAYGFIVEWFNTPSLRRDQYNSWIAQLMPDIITFWAASIVFSTNGNQDKAAKYLKMVQGDPQTGLNGLLHDLKANYLVGKGR